MFLERAIQITEHERNDFLDIYLRQHEMIRVAMKELIFLSMVAH